MPFGLKKYKGYIPTRDDSYFKGNAWELVECYAYHLVIKMQQRKITWDTSKQGAINLETLAKDESLKCAFGLTLEISGFPC